MKNAKTRLLMPLALLLAAPLGMAQDMHLARNLAATCANCHGTNGIAKGEMKTLAGKEAKEIVQLMNEFRAGSRPATIMHQIAKGYTDQQIALVAGYFAALPAKQ